MSPPVHAARRNSRGSRGKCGARHSSDARANALLVTSCSSARPATRQGARRQASHDACPAARDGPALFLDKHGLLPRLRLLRQLRRPQHGRARRHRYVRTRACTTNHQASASRFLSSSSSLLSVPSSHAAAVDSRHTFARGTARGTWARRSSSPCSRHSTTLGSRTTKAATSPRAATSRRPARPRRAATSRRRGPRPAPRATPCRARARTSRLLAPRRRATSRQRARRKRCVYHQRRRTAASCLAACTSLCAPDLPRPVTRRRGARRRRSRMVSFNCA